MPTYDYKCQCGVTYQVVRSFDAAEELPYCPCGGIPKRVYQATPAIFRGTGWGKDGQ